MSIIKYVVFLVIFLLAAFFRLYGVNWDQNQHLHPDERFLTMVSTGISWPKSFEEYLDTANSPLNPHNRGFGFFVYGTFPIFFTKWVAEELGKGDYNNLTIVGRQLSAIFDLGTVILVFLIGKQIISNQQINNSANQQIKKNKYAKTGLLDNWKLDNWLIPLGGMFLYSIMVLPIQLSHFYAVETYLTFLITLSFYLLIKIIRSTNILNYKLLILNSLLGISFGLAIASKISAVLFAPIIGLGFVYILINSRNIKILFVICFMFFILCYLTLRLAQPYLFAHPNILEYSLNQKVVNNWKELKTFDDPTGGFPPAVQWITTKPYLFPLKNKILWGLGLPLGIIAVAATAYTIAILLNSYIVILKNINQQIKHARNFAMGKEFNNRQTVILTLITLWIAIIFLYHGSQFVKALRYFFPIYPFLALLSGYFIYNFFKKLKISYLGYWVIGLLVMIYPLSFLTIYSRPHSRITASKWIYNNISAGSVISSEHWDDGLPMNLSVESFTHEKYKTIEFPLYWPDDVQKWTQMSQNLQKVDYIFLTSNRLYGSTMTYPKKYPVTIRYYNGLFDGSLGFEKVAEFTSRPNLPIPFIKLCLTPPWVRYGIVSMKSQECNLPGVSFVDDYADETFTVYDHPKVTLFKKVKPVDYFKVLYTLNPIP